MKDTVDFVVKEARLQGRAAALCVARVAFQRVVSRLRFSEVQEFYEGIEAEEHAIRKELSDLYCCNNLLKQAEEILAK